MLGLVFACCPRLFLLALGSCSGGFDYLAVAGQTVSTTHDIPADLTVPDRFELMGEVHFQEAYGGPQFNISSVVYTTDTELLAIHAEEHTDGSGGLDYTELTVDTLAGVGLNSRAGCFDLSTETEEDLANNGFLRFLRENGYPFDTVLAMKQYFLTNSAGNCGDWCSHWPHRWHPVKRGSPRPAWWQRWARGPRLPLARWCSNSLCPYCPAGQGRSVATVPPAG